MPAVTFRPDRRCVEMDILRCLSLSSRLLLSPKHFTELAKNTAGEICPRVHLGHPKAIQDLAIFLGWGSSLLRRHHCQQTKKSDVNEPFYQRRSLVQCITHSAMDTVLTLTSGATLSIHSATGWQFLARLPLSLMPHYNS